MKSPLVDAAANSRSGLRTPEPAYQTLNPATTHQHQHQHHQQRPQTSRPPTPGNDSDFTAGSCSAFALLLVDGRHVGIGKRVIGTGTTVRYFGVSPTYQAYFQCGVHPIGNSIVQLEIPVFGRVRTLTYLPASTRVISPRFPFFLQLKCGKWDLIGCMALTNPVTIYPRNCSRYGRGGCIIYHI